MPHRRLDDAEPSITYIGSGWSQKQGLKNATALFNGPPFLGTLHTTSTNSSLSFEFKGTTVTVVGTSVANTTDTAAPSWECFVDGNVLVPRGGNWTISMDNLGFCDGTIRTTPDQLHVLTVNITIISPNSIFSLDWIEYTAIDVPTDGSLLNLNSMDPSINYDASWSKFSPGDAAPYMMTSQQGSKFLYKFTGVSIRWYAHIPPGDKLVANANYSIDGGDPVSFSWLQFPNSDLRNLALFTSPTFPSGEHDLEVVFLGSSDTAPLTLDYLIVNGTSVAPTQTMATQAGSTRAGSTQLGSTQTGLAETSSAPQLDGHTLNVGAVVGGLLGALGLLTGIVGLILFRRRWVPAWQYWRKAALVRKRANRGLLVEPFNRQPALRELRDGSGGVHALRGIKSSVREERSSSNGRSSDRAAGHGSTVTPSRQEDSGIRFPIIGDLPPNYTKV